MRKEIDDTNPGPAVVLDVGEELSLSLSGEHPTAGYRWQLQTQHKSLALLRDDYVPAGSAIGSGGTRCLLFRASAPGQITLQVALGRDFDVPEAARTLEFNITVREPNR